jgi:hypothetical protein
MPEVAEVAELQLVDLEELAVVDQAVEVEMMEQMDLGEEQELLVQEDLKEKVVLELLL